MDYFVILSGSTDGGHSFTMVKVITGSTRTTRMDLFQTMREMVAAEYGDRLNEDNVKTFTVEPNRICELGSP